MTVNEEITAFMQPGASEGWLTPDRGIEMAALTKLMQPETIVSIGVFGGRSVVAFALALKENGRGKVFGIDPWKHEECLEGETPENQNWWKSIDLHQMHRGTMEAIWRLGLEDYAIIIRAASQRLPRLFPGGIDILEIDGSHVEEAAYRDVKLYVPQVNSNGFVIMDDLNWTDNKGHRTTQKAKELLLEYCQPYKMSEDGNWGIFWKKPSPI